MRKPVAKLMENSIQIAWDDLDRTGELGEPEIAAGLDGHSPENDPSRRE
jgi:hypothetical protein